MTSLNNNLYMINISNNSHIGVYNNTGQGYVMNCNILQGQFTGKVNTTITIILIILPLMLLFQWWALTKIANSGESHARKAFMTSFSLLFINGIMILLMFILIYWFLLAGMAF